jgi:hypothetical protein
MQIIKKLGPDSEQIRAASTNHEGMVILEVELTKAVGSPLLWDVVSARAHPFENCDIS